MSRANAAFIEGLFAATSTMSKDALLAALPELVAQIADPEIEWVEDPARADSRVHRGREGVLASWRQWLEQWDEYGFELEHVLDCGEEVFVAARERGSGAASGATVSAHIYLVITVREQKIRRWREYYDQGAARMAAGLPPA
jgi:ketosteroid isomerase-like protein